MKDYPSTTSRQKERKETGKERKGVKKKESDREGEEGKWEGRREEEEARMEGRRKEGKKKKKTPTATGNLS